MPRPSIAVSGSATRHEPAIGFRIWRRLAEGPMPAPHTHPDIEVNFLIDGRFSYLHGGRIAPVEAGRFTVLWGGVPHQSLPPGIPGEGIWCTLPLGWVLQWQLPNAFTDRLLRGEIVSGPAADHESRRLLERWLDDFAQAKNPARMRALQLEMEARFLRLALGLSNAKPRTSPPARESGSLHLTRVTRFLAGHYREPLTVDRVADEVGLHPKYLMRLFKHQCGVGVWEYLTRLRVAHAQRLLITTETKVIDVAFESGFGSLGPFYAAFAAYTPGGVRPLDYRRAHRSATTPIIGPRGIRKSERRGDRV